MLQRCSSDEDIDQDDDGGPSQPNVYLSRRFRPRRHYLLDEDSDPEDFQLQLRDNSYAVQECSSHEREGSECDEDSDFQTEVHPRARCLKQKLPNITS